MSAEQEVRKPNPLIWAELDFLTKAIVVLLFIPGAMIQCCIEAAECIENARQQHKEGE